MIYVLVLVLSVLITIFIKRYAIIDTPNQRSSHFIPTPSGGGLAIVVSFFVGMFYLYFQNMIEQKLLFALLSSTPLIIISFLDDIFTLSSKLRFFVQVISVLSALYFVGNDNLLLNIIFAFCMLWLINLYNFLDGIDGYAVSEAIFVAFAAFMIFQNEIFLILLVAAIGFLPFNWQRASIFMGDVGSTFLGFVFGVFALYYMNSSNDFVIWLILLAVFWFDATFTLIKRFLNGERVTVAHKKHLFQRAVQLGFSHQKVTLYAFFINITAFIALYLLKSSIFVYLVLISYIIILLILAKTIDKRVSFK